MTYDEQAMLAENLAEVIRDTSAEFLSKYTNDSNEAAQISFAAILRYLSYMLPGYSAGKEAALGKVDVMATWIKRQIEKAYREEIKDAG